MPRSRRSSPAVDRFESSYSYRNQRQALHLSGKAGGEAGQVATPAQEGDLNQSQQRSAELGSGPQSESKPQPEQGSFVTLQGKAGTFAEPRDELPPEHCKTGG